MKKVVVLLMLTLLASSAFAVVDDSTNSMGIYFDMNADTYEFAAAPYAIYPAYVMLTNPDFGAVYGYEFGYDIQPAGAFTVTGTVLAGNGPIDVGGGAGNHIVGLASPMATSEATLIATLNIFVLNADPISFELKGAVPNSIIGSKAPAVLMEGDAIMATGLSAGFAEDGSTQICAYINGAGVVATDEVSMDAVKALYR